MWPRTATAPGRNEPYVFCYLFKYRIDLPAGAATLRLPEDAKVRLFAATLADDPAADTSPAGWLYE